MSGPKVDIAEVRKQEMMRLAAARNERKNLSNKIQALQKQVDNCFGSDMQLMCQDESLKANCDKMLAIQEECRRALGELLGQVKSGNELLNVDTISEKAEEITKKFHERIQGERETVNQLAKASQKYQQLEADRQRLAQAKRKKIGRLSSKTQTTDTVVVAADIVTEADVEELSETFKEELGEFMKSGNMTSRHKNTMLLIHQDLQEILQSEIPAERKEKRIKRLFDDYQQMTVRIKDEVAEMEALYEDYVKECFDLSVPAMALHDFSSKEEIEDALDAAKERAETQLSKEYIKRQIDEVMAKHGYDVVKSDMLTEANQSGQILYGVNQDTAINVFVSDENQVTMRVVGIGFDTEISEAEDEKLFQQQCAFCGMHPQITAELAMRGVILHTKKHMPPDRKYNKKLQTKSKQSSQTTSRAKKELKRVEQKTMHKG
ncbi:MAG: hypothetical protein NC419_00675 [Muribaculaceae bacterium]|nr:hypothetical protein [Muribaculaceae bacterium]